uniref:Skp1_POZ domain-containing protein n=1 Tax=Panagrellus redivivus TaxID=6233 RepID=A0A7E4VRN8_PANRE
MRQKKKPDKSAKSQSAQSQKRSQPQPPRQMTLISFDGTEYDVEEYIIRESETFQNAHAKGIHRLVLNNVSGPTLLIVIEFLTLYRNQKPYKPVEIDSKPIRASKNDTGQKYLKKLCEINMESLFHATQEIKSGRLMDGVCAYLLHHMHNKSAAEIRKMFSLPQTSNG